MGKRIASASPPLIEPDLVESANKKYRRGTQDSAALTLLSLREKGQYASIGLSNPNGSVMAFSLKTKTPKDPRTESCNSSSVTDDEDDAVPVFVVTSSKRDPSELKTQPQSMCPLMNMVPDY